MKKKQISLFFHIFRVLKKHIFFFKLIQNIILYGLCFAFQSGSFPNYLVSTFFNNKKAYLTLNLNQRILCSFIFFVPTFNSINQIRQFFCDINLSQSFCLFPLPPYSLSYIYIYNMPHFFIQWLFES